MRNKKYIYWLKITLFSDVSDVGYSFYWLKITFFSDVIDVAEALFSLSCRVVSSVLNLGVPFVAKQDEPIGCRSFRKSCRAEFMLAGGNFVRKRRRIRRVQFASAQGAAFSQNEV
jgi:hypothetical protein